jgi:hypothetical protein
MKRISYNALRNMRIRSIVVLGLSMIITVLVVGIAVTREITSFHLIMFGLLYLLVALPLMFMPFGNTLEKLEDGKFTSYFLVGPVQFMKGNYHGPVTFIVEPDQAEQHCLSMMYSNGEKLVIERYPTREGAEKRLEDFGKLLS